MTLGFKTLELAFFMLINLKLYYYIFSKISREI